MATRQAFGMVRCARALVGLLAFVLLAAACGAESSKDKLFGSALPASDAGEVSGTDDGDAADEPKPPLAYAKCRKVDSSERLQAREAVMSADVAAGAAQRSVTVDDLFGRFVDLCGRCHTNGRNQGGFDVSLPRFAELVDEESLDRIRYDDTKEPNYGMPQPAVRFSLRSPGDPVVQFAADLEQWLKSGKPDIFYPEKSGEQGGRDPSASPYLVTRSVGMELTNLGNCVPEPAMMGNQSDRAAELDAAFRKMDRFEDLPKNLRDTDLFTLDSAKLAEQGVVAYAPAYTLWADNAQKIRYVRVPQGESIRFNEDEQSFNIPANTRFYKTFLKRVTDLDGNVRYRKMETRIIVARPDEELADGSYATHAIFGSYKWNEAETEAVLNDAPYTSDNTGFRDDLFTYVVDEREEYELLSKGASAEELLSSGARRSYAIPGSDRCHHCHMGSPTQSFVLGFIPLQINRKPLGESGVIEPAHDDELNQFQRLVDYGVITGVDSAEKVAPLEASQGNREPRNDHELKAQGYMLGNCAHCHNPRGFPSQREKVLADTLDFLPSERGGVFQFPLDKLSPRSFRGVAQNVKIPYITPSLFDWVSPEQASSAELNTLKWIQPASEAGQRSAGVQHDLAKGVLIPKNPDPLEAELVAARGAAFDRLPPGRPLLAPWRSLIYRNVDTPFTYSDTAAIYPHMPMDTPGYDCRARRLLGNWMVSIPAKRLNASNDEPGTLLADYEEAVDQQEQPYQEVSPDSILYRRYSKYAETRLAQFQASERYHDCPSPELDVVDPWVLRSSDPAPRAQRTELRPDADDAEVYEINIPERPHYARTDLHPDLTWEQRRVDWYKILVSEGVDEARAKKGGATALASAQAIEAVRSRLVTDPNSGAVREDLRKLALEPIPFGVWQAKPACKQKLKSLPKVADLKSNEPPGWTLLNPGPAPDAPVYMISRGQQVFNTVCSKCHGAEGNGVSALSNTISDLTGGKTRVANLRDGLLGPASDPEANWKSTFAQAEGQLGSHALDWAARYVAWMGLGGTNAYIPSAVLAQMGSAAVLGERRTQNLGAVTDSEAAANMLNLVKNACLKFMSPTGVSVDFDVARGELLGAGKARSLESLGLIASNGDSALWRDLCYFDNPAPVTAVQFTHSFEVVRIRGNSYISRDRYPAQPVGDQHGRVVSDGVYADNLGPWCVYAKAEDEPALQDYESRVLGYKVPRCPPELLDRGAPRGDLTEEQAALWAAKGAANAGISVFLYLQALVQGKVTPVPSYDRCEELK